MSNYPTLGLETGVLTRQCKCITIYRDSNREIKMTAILEAESKLTDRYQTTVPEPVRRALKLGKRDRIHYTIRSDGDVVLTRARVTEDEDPAIGAFLDFLARDIADHPQRLQAVDTELARRIQSLTADIDIDLDASLPADEE